MSAIYLGLSPDTAIREFYGSEEHTPLVLLPVQFELLDVIDVTGDLRGWPRDWKKWNCNWRKALSSSAAAPDCASWRCGDDAVRRRASAILYPSQYNPGSNAVALFPEDATIGTCSFAVQDPFGAIRAANPPVL